MTDSSPRFLQVEFATFLALASAVRVRRGMRSRRRAGVLLRDPSRGPDGADSTHADVCVTGVRAKFPPPPPFPNSNQSLFVNTELGHYPGRAHRVLRSR